MYAATVGGVRLTEPSVDLAVALAFASGLINLSVPGSVVAVGEVGLAGEVRQVNGVARRLAEAERLGFRLALVPAGQADADRHRPGGRARRRDRVDRSPRGDRHPGRDDGRVRRLTRRCVGG